MSFVCIYGLLKMSNNGEDPDLYLIGAATLTLAVIIVRVFTTHPSPCSRRLRACHVCTTLRPTPCTHSRT